MRWTYISTLQTKTSLDACRKCLCWLPGLSGSPATSSTPMDQQRRKPAGQMYSASGAVRSAVGDQQIGDDAVTWRRRLVGRRRAGTAALDHVHSYTSYIPFDTYKYSCSVGPELTFASSIDCWGSQPREAEPGRPPKMIDSQPDNLSVLLVS